MKHKTKKELNTLTDARLLNYYKSIRGKTASFVHSFYCDCCGTPDWEFNYGETKEERQEKKELCLSRIEKAEDYLKFVKTELEKRGHVER